MNLEKNFHPDNVVEVNEQVIKHKAHLGSFHIPKGSKMYEMDRNFIVKEAEYKEEILTMGGGVRRKLILNQGSRYKVAINLKNAKRKFLKDLLS